MPALPNGAGHPNRYVTTMLRILLASLIILSVSAYASKPLSDYERGVNNALQAIMLLDLELKLKGERKTWGEMAEIVRTRLKVRSYNKPVDLTRDAHRSTQD